MSHTSSSTDAKRFTKFLERCEERDSAKFELSRFHSLIAAEERRAENLQDKEKLANWRRKASARRREIRRLDARIRELIGAVDMEVWMEWCERIRIRQRQRHNGQNGS